MRTIQELTSGLTRRSVPLQASATGSDRVRQALNVLLALGQSATTVVVVATGASAITSGDPRYTTVMVPAVYAFSIWSALYAGTAADGIYQARPSAATDPLLRRVGWLTAPAFGGTSLRLLAAQRQWIWSTVAIFAGMLACLGGALARISARDRGRGSLSPAERLLVRAPLSVFAGWSSAAVLANLSIALKVSGALPTPTAEHVVAGSLIATAGVAGAAATTALRGDRWYAGTVLWALVAIAVASATRREPVPGIAAAGAAVVVGVAAARAPSRRQHAGRQAPLVYRASARRGAGTAQSGGA